MIRTLLAVAAICAVAGPAMAGDVSRGKTQCGWQQGVYVCQSKYESDYGTTTTLCATGDYGTGGCSTKTVTKEQPKPQAPLEADPNSFDATDAGARARAEEQAAKARKEGRIGAVICRAERCRTEIGIYPAPSAPQQRR